MLTVCSFVEGDFAAGAVLISFGAVIGRITPTQLLSMAFIELIFYGLNYAVIYHQGLADIGGTYVIHMFGAYYGLAVSRVLSAKKPKQTGWEHNTANYHSDVFAMIGELMLVVVMLLLLLLLLVVVLLLLLLLLLLLSVTLLLSAPSSSHT